MLVCTCAVNSITSSKTLYFAEHHSEEIFFISESFQFWCRSYFQCCLFAVLTVCFQVIFILKSVQFDSIKMSTLPKINPRSSLTTAAYYDPGYPEPNQFSQSRVRNHFILQNLFTLCKKDTFTTLFITFHNFLYCREQKKIFVVKFFFTTFLFFPTCSPVFLITTL